MIVKNANKLIDGQVPGAYLKFTINLQSSISSRMNDEMKSHDPIYTENRIYNTAETFLHESQHLRITMGALLNNTPQPSEYNHHKMMKEKSGNWHKERENFFKWGTPLQFKLRMKEEGKQRMIHDFRMGGYYEDKKPIRVIQVK
jgi:hypothetical protein